MLLDSSRRNVFSSVCSRPHPFLYGFRGSGSGFVHPLRFLHGARAFGFHGDVRSVNGLKLQAGGDEGRAGLSSYVFV